MWIIIALGWIALIIGIVWSYRRQQAKREAERAEKFAGLLKDLKGVPDALPAAAPAPVPLATPVAQPERIATTECRAKSVLLPQPHALLYFILRTGLPDHEIFANLALADVIELGDKLRGYDRDQKIRALAQLKVDFVICNRQLQLIAVILVIDSAPAAETSQKLRPAEQWLEAAGVRVVHIDRASLPRHHQVRELVYGRDSAKAAQG
jgi:hypothetical protein